MKYSLEILLETLKDKLFFEFEALVRLIPNMILAILVIGIFYFISGFASRMTTKNINIPFPIRTLDFPAPSTLLKEQI